MSPIKKLFIPLLTGLLLLGGLACSSGDGSQSITLYSGRDEELIQPLIDDYTEATGVQVDVKYGDSAELALLISEEGDNSPADVFLSQSPGAIGFLEREGLLAEISAEVLDLVETTYHSPEGTWVGVSGRKRLLVYNEDLVDPAELPDSVLDLVDPSFEGRVAVAPTNGSFQDFVTGLRGEVGDEAALEWLEGMAANNSPEYAKNSAIVEAVGRGEVPMGLVNHYYNYRALDEDPSLPSRNHDFDPDDIGSLMIITAAGVLESSGDKETAEELISFLLGREAQAFFAGETFEYPLAAGVEPPEGLEPFEATQAKVVEYADLGDDLESTIVMIRESGLDG